MQSVVQRPEGFSKPFRIFQALLLAAVVFFVYASSLTTGFFADDYNFIEPAARLDPPQYLAHYFDPRVQTMWYRPMQGIQIWIEWQLFGANAAGYHLVQILIHVVNCWLLFALVARVAQKAETAPREASRAKRVGTPPTRQDMGALPAVNAWRLGLLAAFLYATFPVYALAINWINITDPMMMIFYLAGVWCWLNYLERRASRDYALTLLMFAIALSFKQMALTLPAILFLVDGLLVNPIRARDALKNLVGWIRRYLAFGVVAVAFFAIQYLTRSTHTFAGVFGYTVGPHIVSIIAQYLSLLAFPWGYYPATDTQVLEFPDFIPPATVAWMLVALALYLLLLAKTKNRALLFLGAAIFVALLPVIPFPFIELRYLYLPAIGSAILLALLFDHALNLSRLARFFAPFVLALLVLGNAFAVANANAGIYEIARQRRVPFRDISRAHVTFPDDTLLYFIDPVSPLSELSGMFTLRYGRGVTVSGDAHGIAALRAHNAAYVYYFDETGKPMEVAVERNGNARASFALPADLNAPIKLEGFEIAASRVKRGETLVLLLYWRATGDIGKDYTVFAHLVDARGQVIAQSDSQPRKGAAPTREWKLQAVVVDPILLAIPADAPQGEYRLEIGMYDPITLERVQFVDAQGADKVTIAPILIQ